MLWSGYLIVAVIFLYPTFMDNYRKIHQTAVIGSYDEAVTAADTEYITEMKERTTRYNQELYEGQMQKSFSYQGAKYDDEEYDTLLSMTELSNVMGYIEIPTIDVYLPIAHGTHTVDLEYEVGHMYGTSLPFGGSNTHSVIAGHTGLKNALLFTNLVDMRTGDIFYIHVLDEIHEYTVDQIRVVLPEDADPYLQIIENGDYVTLYTCTPYGVNDHRLLVRGKRTGNIVIGDDGGENIQSTIKNRQAITRMLLMILIPLLLFSGGVIWIFRTKSDVDAV